MELGELHDGRVHEEKKRKLIGNTKEEEIENINKIAKRIISENSGEVLVDVNTAIGKMEARRRDEVHAGRIAKHLNSDEIVVKRKKKRK